MSYGFRLRTHYCGELGIEHVGQEVNVLGWVHRTRDHGELIFVDLRDRFGIVQIVFDPEKNRAIHELARTLRKEFVIGVTGTVVRRGEGLENPSLKTGLVEVVASHLDIISPAKTTPFFVDDGQNVDETLRLKYRYLDLRTPSMTRIMVLRHNFVKAVRDYLSSKNFLEIETPMLTRSTPEGARDFLVPSRLNPGKFYALPQSPQLFKQLLMVAGMDRYFQIARCFRDEDLRLDRQPEFTQIDIEMSFVTQEVIQETVEGLVQHVFRTVAGIDVPVPFPRMKYEEAMNRYGVDKPDTRFGMEIIDLTGDVRDGGFGIFDSALADVNGTVRGIVARKKRDASGKPVYFSRKEIDSINERAVKLGAKGAVVAYFSPSARSEDVTGEISSSEAFEVKSPLVKVFGEEKVRSLLKKHGVEPGDLLVMLAGAKETVLKVLGQLRLELATEFGIIPEKQFNFLWVVDFPAFEWDEEENRWVARHHPFTSPKPEHLDLFETNPGAMLANAYDLVLNGFEVAGGSIRIHRRDIQERMFRTLNISDEEAREKFGFLLEAFEYGVPPHGGIAFGLERLIMLVAGANSIRDVIAFPKTASATCHLTNAPSEVSEKQLEELSIMIKKPV